jgi:uncharacterized membrane protein YccC
MLASARKTGNREARLCPRRPDSAFQQDTVSVPGSSVLDILGRFEAEIRLTLRVTIAAVLGYVLAKLLGLPQPTWVVITAVIVMQASLGGSVKAAADRMAGTLVGAAYGAGVAVLLPHRDEVHLGLAILAAVAPMALLAALRASFRVAPITALIVLAPLTPAATNPLTYALERVAEIGLGVVVGVAVALFVLPARAHGLLASTAARVADLNADLLAALVEGLTAEQGRPGLQALHAGIRASLKKAETAAEEAARERRSHLTEMADPEPIIRTLYRVRHDLVMVGRTAATPLPAGVLPHLLGGLFAVRDAAVATLRASAAALRTGTAAPATDAFEASLKSYLAQMDRMRQDGVMRSLPGEDVGRIYALRFAFEQMALDLRDLVARIDGLGAGGTPPAAGAVS